MHKKLISLLLILSMVLAITACKNEPAPAQSAPAEGNTATAGTSAGDAAPAAPTGGEYVLPEGISPISDIVKSFDYITLDVLGQDQLGSRKPTEDILTPIWREKTRVTVDVIVPPDTRDWLTYVQMNTVADTLPTVIAVTNGLMDNIESYTVLRNSGQMLEIKLEWLEQYMPETKKLLAKMNLTIEDWYNANKDPITGKLHYVPNPPTQLLIPDARTSAYGSYNLGEYPYMCWFRDDILKQVYPQAKTEKELKELALSKGGEITAEDIMDIPMNNLDDLLTYMRAVKDLGLVENGKPIIPGHIHKEVSMDAMRWSLYTAANFYWGETAGVVPETRTYIDYSFAPGWKEYLRFINTAFNEGLFGQEYFTQKMDQADAKIVNGEYAIINWWSPVDGNRDKVKQEGTQDYGWRLYPIFDVPLLQEYQDRRETCLVIRNISNAKAFNASKVTEDMIPQLLNWLDWNYSEEAQILRFWGTPNMYTGEGENRRFTEEFKDVETYFLSGQMDSTKKDAWYYGLHIPDHDDRNLWNHEVYGILDAYNYYLAPQYVYPVEGDNFMTMPATLRAYRKKNLEQMIYLQEGQLGQDALDAYAAWQLADQDNTTYDQKYKDQRDLAMLEALTCPPDQFDAKFDAYRDMGWDDEKQALWQNKADTYWDYYEKRQAYREVINLR